MGLSFELLTGGGQIVVARRVRKCNRTAISVLHFSENLLLDSFFWHLEESAGSAYAVFDRSDRKPARTSSEKSFGCSQAA